MQEPSPAKVTCYRVHSNKQPDLWKYANLFVIYNTVHPYAHQMYQLCKVPHNDNDETDKSRQENENGKYDLVKGNRETMVLNKEIKRLSVYMHALSTHLIVFRYM